MNLRDYQPSDKKGVSLLNDEFGQEFFAGFYTDLVRDHWESELTAFHGSKEGEENRFWIIEHEGEIIGTVGLRVFDGNTAELIRMRVKREYRGRGLGKKLLQRVEEHCRDINRRKIVLHTAKNLVIARKMYERQGFKLYSEQQVEDGFTVMSYVKILDD